MRYSIALVAFMAGAFGQMTPLEQKIADLTELIDRKPDFAGAYYARGMTQLSAGQYWLAEVDLSKAIELKPDAALYASRAGLYAATKRADAAIADLTLAVMMRPDNSSYYLRRANIFRAKGDCSKAIADYNQVIRTFPNEEALRGRAACKKELGDPVGAAEDDARIEQSRAGMNAIIGSIPSAAPPAPPRAATPAPEPRTRDLSLIPPNAFRIGGGVSQPSLLFKVQPEYSEEARKAKWQGTVLLAIVIDEFGEPQNLTVTRGLGLGLDEQAVEAVRKWVFKPSRKDGQPVAVYANIEVTFHLL